MSAVPVASVLIFLVPNYSQAQVVRISKANGVRPQISSGSLTLVVTPAVVTFSLSPGQASVASSPIVIQTTSVSLTNLTTVSLYGYFLTSQALTDSAGDSIPTSAVFGLCSSGAATAYSAFVQSGPFASGSSLLIWQEASTGTSLATRTDTLSMKIDLTAIPSLSPSTYTGTLYLQVHAL